VRTGRPTLTEAEQDRRLRLYEKGLDDREMAEVLGLSKNTIGTWRKKNDLPRNGSYPRKSSWNSVAMEKALTEDQCVNMRRFFGYLEKAKKINPKSLNITALMKFWREEKMCYQDGSDTA